MTAISEVKPVVLVYRREVLPVSETFIKEQILALQNWEAVLVGHARGGLALDGLRVQLLGRGRASVATRALRKIRVLPYRPESALEGMLPGALENIRQTRGALIHAHFGTDALSAWPLAQTLKLPMVVTLHGYDVNIRRDLWETGKYGRGMKTYPSRLIALANEPTVEFIAVSEALRQRAIAFGLPANKIRVRYIGIDVKKFRSGGSPLLSRHRRVLFIGRLVEKKGCRYLISAMAAVQNKLPEAELVVVGDGPLRQALEAQALELGVRAEFRGALPAHAVRKELDQAAVFCLPSVTAADGNAESFGMVLLEAQAMGVPVVTSAIGGSKEGIKEGETGFSFAECDVDDLAIKLINLLSDEALASSMSKAGPAFVAERFDILNCTSLLEACYSEMLPRCIRS